MNCVKFPRFSEDSQKNECEITFIRANDVRFRTYRTHIYLNFVSNLLTFSLIEWDNKLLFRGLKMQRIILNYISDYISLIHLNSEYNNMRIKANWFVCGLTFQLITEGHRGRYRSFSSYNFVTSFDWYELAKFL